MLQPTEPTARYKWVYYKDDGERLSGVLHISYALLPEAGSWAVRSVRAKLNGEAFASERMTLTPLSDLKLG